MNTIIPLLACCLAADPVVMTLCLPRAEIVTPLRDKFHESQIGIGLTNEGAILEIFSSPDGETWAVIINLPNGTTCVVGSGTYWRIPLQGRPP